MGRLGPQDLEEQHVYDRLDDARLGTPPTALETTGAVPAAAAGTAAART